MAEELEHGDEDPRSGRSRGIRISRAMNSRGLRKLSALAAAVGVTDGAISRWRQGGPITLENAIRLCDALDVSMDWLILGRGHMDHSGNSAIPGKSSYLNDLPVGAIQVLEEFLAFFRPV